MSFHVMSCHAVKSDSIALLKLYTLQPWNPLRFKFIDGDWEPGPSFVLNSDCWTSNTMETARLQHLATWVGSWSCQEGNLSSLQELGPRQVQHLGSGFWLPADGQMGGCQVALGFDLTSSSCHIYVRQGPRWELVGAPGLAPLRFGWDLDGTTNSLSQNLSAKVRTTGTCFKWAPQDHCGGQQLITFSSFGTTSGL